MCCPCKLIGRWSSDITWHVPFYPFWQYGPLISLFLFISIYLSISSPALYYSICSFTLSSVLTPSSSFPFSSPALSTNVFHSLPQPNLYTLLPIRSMSFLSSSVSTSSLSFSSTCRQINLYIVPSNWSWISWYFADRLIRVSITIYILPSLCISRWTHSWIFSIKFGTSSVYAQPLELQLDYWFQLHHRQRNIYTHGCSTQPGSSELFWYTFFLSLKRRHLPQQNCSFQTKYAHSNIVLVFWIHLMVYRKMLKDLLMKNCWLHLSIWALNTIF